MRFRDCVLNIIAPFVLSLLSVVRDGLEPITSDSSDRHASFTTPDQGIKLFSRHSQFTNVRAYFPRSYYDMFFQRIFSTQLLYGAARTFYAVDRAVLESASPGFQPGATPSQLPIRQNAQKHHIHGIFAEFLRKLLMQNHPLS
jgi:hypothetical protein